MRTYRFFIAFVVATSLAGCTSSPQKAEQSATRAPHVFKAMEFQYDQTKSEAFNFAQRLDSTVFQCGTDARTGSLAVRYANPQKTAEYSQSLLACNTHARSEGDAAVARLRAANLPERQTELAKQLYAKWSAYLGTISIYTPPDIRAASEYRAAKEALLTEVKFAQ